MSFHALQRPKLLAGIEYAIEGARLPNSITLGVVNSDDFQRAENGFTIDKLGHRFFTHDVSNLVDGFHHGVIDSIVEDILHEQPVDLEKVDRQIFK